jgi:hypothetical protein
MTGDREREGLTPAGPAEWMHWFDALLEFTWHAWCEGQGKDPAQLGDEDRAQRAAFMAWFGPHFVAEDGMPVFRSEVNGR